MEKIHENLPKKDFTQPDGIVSKIVCKKSGLLAADFCSLEGSAYSEYFDEDNVPTETCSRHGASSSTYICSVTGQLASGDCPFKTVGTPLAEGHCPHVLQADGTIAGVGVPALPQQPDPAQDVTPALPAQPTPDEAAIQAALAAQAAALAAAATGGQ